MRPADVLAHRRLLLAAAAEKARWDYAEYPARSHAIMLTKITHATDTQNFYVSTDMTALALAAAPHMPRQNYLLGDTPAAAGFLMFDGPACTFAMLEDDEDEGEDGHYGEPKGTVHGFAWITVPDVERPAPPDTVGWVGPADEVWVYPLARFYGDTRLFPLSLSRPHLETGEKVDHPWVWRQGWEPLGEPGGADVSLSKLLLTTWTVMQQKLADHEVATGDRAERRRTQRAGLPDEVTVIRLRKIEHKQAEGEGSPVDWSHRWIVDGHWRNQWLPSRHTHRQQWISGYVKGPEDKPLVIKPKVNAWVR